MIRVRFLPDAEAELLHEIAYYSKARQGFGVRFKDAVKVAADKAARTPEAGAPGLAGTRKFRAKGFPFSLCYRQSDDEIVVVALALDNRQPAYWLRRVD